MLFPKLDFRWRRRPAPSSSSSQQTLAPPPPTADRPTPKPAFYSHRSFSTLSFATARSTPAGADPVVNLGPSGLPNGGGGGGGFMKKLAHRIASKHDLKQAFRTPGQRQPRLSFNDSDDSGSEPDDDGTSRPPSLPPPVVKSLPPHPAGDPPRRPCLKHHKSQPQLSSSFTTTHPASRRPAAPAPHPADTAVNRLSSIEFLRSVGPSCTADDDDGARMWAKYRADRARRASTVGLPFEWRAHGAVEVRTLCTDPTEEGRQALSRVGIVDELPLLPKSAKADAAGHKVTLLPSRSALFDQPSSATALDKAARRAISCDALSKAYATHAPSQAASERLEAYRLAHAPPTVVSERPAATAAAAGSARRVSTRPAAPAPGTCASPTKQPAAPRPVAEASSARPAARSVAPAMSPPEPPAEPSFHGYPDSILHGYERTLDHSVVAREPRDVVPGRPAVHSVVSDSFAYDARRSPSGTEPADGDDDDEESLRTCSSVVSTPTSCTFDNPILDGSARGRPREDSARVQAADDDDGENDDRPDESAPLTPHMSFIDLAPFPSPLSMHRLSFSCDDSFATSTPLRPLPRKSASRTSLPPLPANPRAADDDTHLGASTPDNTSPSMCSEASFSDAYFVVATRATTTVPRILQRAVQTPLPSSPTDAAASLPVSPPADLGPAGQHQWRKLSQELGLCLPADDERPEPTSTPTSHPWSTAVPRQLAVAQGTPTPSEVSLELFRARLRAALSPVGRSYDAITTPERARQHGAETSARFDPSVQAPKASTGRTVANASVRRRMTPRYKPARRLSIGPSDLRTLPLSATPFTPPRAPLNPTRSAPTRLDSTAAEPARVAKRPPTLDLADLSLTGQEAMKQAWLAKLDFAMLAAGQQ